MHERKEPNRSESANREALHIVIAAVPPVRTLDVIGPLEVFGDANGLRSSSPPYRIDVVSAADELVVPSHTGFPLLANRSYLDVRGPVDTILVAGGPGARTKQYAPGFLEWLREQCHLARRFGSVCTGAFVLADAGLLNGRRATTHWNWCQELKRSYPEVQVDPDPIYVRDANCYTSAGVTAGIDLALALVDEDLGASLALQVAKMLVVFLRRPGGQSQFSTTLTAQNSDQGTLGELLAWLPDNLQHDLSVGTLARRAAMSPRNFARVFLEQVGVTPGKYIEDLRLESARRHLESGAETMEMIADRVGYQSAEVLRRAFDRRFGVTPGYYRASFGTK